VLDLRLGWRGRGKNGMGMGMGEGEGEGEEGMADGRVFCRGGHFAGYRRCTEGNAYLTVHIVAFLPGVAYISIPQNLKIKNKREIESD
jgi:hypothetical protein